VVGGSAIGAVTYTPAPGTVLLAGNNQKLHVDVASTTNYNPANQDVSINVTPRDAVASYIGQTVFSTSGTSSTTAQVTLTASIQDPTGNQLASMTNATVSF